MEGRTVAEFLDAGAPRSIRGSAVPATGCTTWIAGYLNMTKCKSVNRLVAFLSHWLEVSYHAKSDVGNLYSDSTSKFRTNRCR